MKTGRLLLSLYLGLVVVVFVVGGLALAIATVRKPSLQDFQIAARHMLPDLARLRGDPAALRRELAGLEDLPLAVTLYAPDGTLLDSSITPPLSATDKQPWLVSMRIEIDGRFVATGVARLGDPRRDIALALLVLIAMLVALSVVLARYVGGPMQRIAAAARRFGAGDLAARTGVRRNDELGEVARAFDDMAERVTRLMTAQRELMANVSHELQTPLSRIQVTVDLMLDGIDDRAKELLPEISHDLGEVERLIEDVMTLSRLDLSRADAAAIGAPLRCEPTELGDLVEQAVSRFGKLHPTRVVTIERTPAPCLSLDRVLVRRVIENLLDNARKYSEPDSPIAVNVTADATVVRVAVTDHGIGIDEADLARMFTPFYRTDRSRTRATGGVGLGLVLAKRVVEAHGGRIGIEAAPATGTTVHFELPLPTSSAR